jgi:hypothetical protein
MALRALLKLGLVGVVALVACEGGGDGGGGSDSGSGGTAGSDASVGGTTDGGGATGGTTSTGGTAGSGGGAGAMDAGQDGDAAPSGDSGPDASVVSATQACSDYADAYCTLLSQCEPFHVPLWFGDLATCKQRMALPCLAMLGHSGTTWNGDVMAGCAQALSQEACGSWYTHTLLPECVPPAGAAADGSPCRDGGQCQSSHCLVPNDSLDGVCSPAPGANSSACYVDDDCATGWLCSNPGDSAPGQCLQTVGSGGICLNKVCAKNLDCIPDSCTICPPQPTCKSALGVFYTCQNNYAGQCDDLKGLTCGKNGASYVCLQQTVAQIGDACTGPCAANAECTAQPDGGSICVAVPDGGSCDNQSGPLCMPPAKCVSGTCQI